MIRTKTPERIEAKDISEVTPLIIKTVGGCNYLAEWYNKESNGDFILKESIKESPPPILKGNTFSKNIYPDGGLREANSGHSAGHLGDISDADGWALAKKFDAVMREHKGEWVNKREVADICGTSYKEDSFRRLLYRRKTGNQPSILVHGRNPDLIKLINRDYEVTDLSSPLEGKWIDTELPFDLHKLIQIPRGSVGEIGGMKDAGKTAFMLEICEKVLLSTDMDVWYFYNEFSKSRFKIRAEDFPVLVEMYEKKRFYPVRQEGQEVKDIMHPDVCTVYDYIRRTEDFYKHAKDIDDLADKVGEGMLWFGLQKSTVESKHAFGGAPTLWRPNITLFLNFKEQIGSGIRGHIAINNAKDYVGEVNPQGYTCYYKSGGKHGRLFQDGEWGKLKGNTFIPFPMGDAHTEVKSQDSEPENPCHVCGKEAWYKRGNQWTCRVCHPEPRDELLTCSECGKSFPFYAAEYMERAEQGNPTKPTKCNDCRFKRDR